MIRFKKVKDDEKDILTLLHQEAFPGDYDRDFSDDVGWLILDAKKVVIGFCTVAPLKFGEAFLSRAASFRSGGGIHRASIRYRLNWLRRNGFKYAVTYCSIDNYKSISGLIRSGFQMYTPKWPYAGTKDYLYFQKTL